MVFDDGPSLALNPTLQAPLDWSAILTTEGLGGATPAGRPLLNLSFAVQTALRGDSLEGWHSVNFLIHLANALLLGC